MEELPISIKRSIRKNDPIEMDGFTLYPILVEEMDEFNEARPAIEFMQQSLPVTYAVIPLLQAFFALDMDSQIKTGKPTGLFYRALLSICLSLRLGQNMPPQERVKLFKFRVDKNDPSKLLAVRFLYNGEEIREITPSLFSKIRPIIAAQNGLTIPDESANQELIEAKQDIQRMTAANVIVDFDTQLVALASAEGVGEAEIMNWPIRKFIERFKAVDRRLRFLVYGIGEMSGNVKWKNGNPVPSWAFDKVESNPALIPLGNFMGGKGQEAVNRALSNKGVENS